jgi:hypothetical protein
VLDFEILAQPTKGFVSFDAQTGAILSVGMRLPEDNNSILEVTTTEALEFLEGVRSLQGWMVGTNVDQKTMRLIKLGASEVTLSRASIPPLRLLDAIPALAPVCVEIQMAQHGGPIGVKLSTHERNCNVRGETSDVTLDIIVTKKQWPEVILDRHNVIISELSKAKFLQLDNSYVGDIELYTIPLSSVSYHLEIVNSVSAPLFLPHRRFEDISWFVRGNERPGLLLNFDQTARQLRFKINEDGGRRFNRGLTAMRVALCLSKNPDEFLWSFYLDLEPLIRNEVIEIDLPKEISEQSFEVFTQKLFEHLVWVEKF